MDRSPHNQAVSFIRGIAGDVPPDVCVRGNFETYLSGFSRNAREIISKLGLHKQPDTLKKASRRSRWISGAEGVAANLPGSSSKALRIPVPPEAGAMGTGRHLSAETVQITTALIAEVVTGKINVHISS